MRRGGDEERGRLEDEERGGDWKMRREGEIKR